MNQHLAWLLVAICGILRSTDLYFRNPMIKSLPVVVLIAWEHLINFIVILPVLWLKRREFLRFDFRDFALIIGIGVGASALGVLCFTQAFHYINPALAVLLQKLQPVMTIFLGMLLLRERVTGSFAGWAILAIICSYFVSFGFSDPFTGEGASMAKGAAFAVAAAFFWGSGTVWGKFMLQKYDQNFVLACRFMVGSIFTLALALIVAGDLHIETLFSGERPLIGNVIYMALISGILATSFFYAGLKWVRASLASILELVFPVSSVVIMWLSFDRPITGVQIIAACLMFLAVYQINLLTEKNT